MNDLPDPVPESSRRARGRARTIDWSALFRKTTPESALREVAACLGGDVAFEAVLEIREAPGSPVARFRAGPASSAGHRQGVEVPGEPPWTLTVHRPTGRLAWATLQEAGAALAAWRAARLELERDERHLEARTRELALLQDLGRTAAEARTPEDQARCIAARTCKNFSRRARPLWTSIL